MLLININIMISPKRLRELALAYSKSKKALSTLPSGDRVKAIQTAMYETEVRNVA